MSDITLPNPKPAKSSACSESSPWAFCPHDGLETSASLYSSDQLTQLLYGRLRIAAWVLGLGMLAFLLRGFFPSENSEQTLGESKPLGGWVLRLPHAATVLILLSSAALLTWKKHASCLQLRWMEGVIFGTTGLWFLWFVFQSLRSTVEPLAMPALIVSLGLPWVLLIQIYGLFIPNNLKRSVIVLSGMALAFPLLVIVYAFQNELAARSLSDGSFVTVSMVLALSTVASIYGSHRFFSLQTEVRDAKKIGVYTLKEKLGEGGMGAVYRAEHHLLKRPCAIKLIQPDQADNAIAINRFHSEVQASAQLSHPNTINIYDYGYTETGVFYYVMEYLPGMSLDALVKSYGPLPSGRVVYLLRQVCGALQEAHREQLIHRDIKPGNIFAAERGGFYDVVKLLDFGLVKSSTSSENSLHLTSDGVLLGSPLFASPDMVLGLNMDARSDIYSVGATAYYLLTGQPVFSGKNAVQVMFAHAHQPVVPPGELVPEIDPQLERIVLKCLQKRPEDRYASAEQLLDALEDCPCDWTARQARKWWLKLPPTLPSTDVESTTDRMAATAIAVGGAAYQ